MLVYIFDELRAGHVLFLILSRYLIPEYISFELTRILKKKVFKYIFLQIEANDKIGYILYVCVCVREREIRKNHL